MLMASNVEPGAAAVGALALATAHGIQCDSDSRHPLTEIPKFGTALDAWFDEHWEEEEVFQYQS
jgi:hypothetical protein